VDEYFYKYRVHSFPVLDSARQELVGHITAKQIRSISRENWGDKKVGDVMISVQQLPHLTADQDAYEVLQEMLIHNFGRLPVWDASGQQLAGIVTRKDIFEYVHMREEIEGDQQRLKHLEEIDT
jgi:predicted transcriptional regulator